MRRFWHPVCMSMELTDTPRFVELMGEELVACRDKSGNVGVWHAHCCHRGASLEYGMIQDKGIMCSYHGWKFDLDGRCYEVPAALGEEKDGEAFAASVWQGAYKAFEKHGLVFVYMGPPEEEPPFPDWEGGLVAPGDEIVAFSNFQHCNWLQVQDNPADQYHHIPLHTTAVVPGHEQTTTFAEAGATPFKVRPDLQFFNIQEGRGIAWTSSRRISDDKIFIRVNSQVLPNLSFHSYLFETGEKRKIFSRVHMLRWTTPVTNTTSKMIGWRIVGPTIDPRGLGLKLKHLIGYETIDFLNGQVAMRRPERIKYLEEDPNGLPPIPGDHRTRKDYKDAQYAPGDYEVQITQRPIAVHALENPMKCDGGVYMFRKLLRDAVNGDNPKTSAAAWREWFQENNARNTFCQGNILEIPGAPTQAEEVEKRRAIAKDVIAATRESDNLSGDERVKFIEQKYAEIEKKYS